MAKAKQADGAADSSTAGRMPQAKPGESAGEKSASLGPNAASADVRAAAEPAATSEKPAAMDEKPAPAPEEKANVEQDKSAKDAQATKLQANQAVADNIRKDLEKLVKTRTTEGPSFDVVADGSGVLISVGDESKFGMFDIGSAVPRPETVNAMAEIGKLLAETKGQVIVAGHTDARKFSGGSYDNWRLSTDRAHIARYMLIRGGLEESRFERVEGFADSQPKLPDDPLAAANRRIEIRVRLP